MGFISTIIQARRGALIADDLTGACDAGAEFARRGFSTLVWLDSSQEPGCDADVLVLNTDSRESNEDAATERAAACCRQLQAQRIPVLMQKVDSALRGHWAAQTVCIADLSGRSRAFISPTFPEYGRTLVQGRVQAADLPGFAAYAELRRVAGNRAQSIDLHRLAEGEDTDGSIALVDTRTQADLAKLVGYAFERWPNALLVGSAAMAAEIASRLAPRCPPEKMTQPDHGWVVYWIGSLHPATCKQVAWLESRATPEEMVVPVDFTNDEPQRLCTRAARLQQMPLAAFVLSGGDTASWILRIFEAEAIRLEGVVRTGIPFGRILGGRFNGLRVVTKSGSFGGETTLEEIAQFLRK